ncbi:hypothetical protein AB0436_06640 [Streptomyces sp. NPDC051322]|uniref:hypothetical protein n=1 Tax=Streptomyces sp. NPDC051322 TaxID=3154645 RepID=UPI003450CCDB
MTSEIAESRTTAEQTVAAQPVAAPTVAEQPVGAPTAFPFGSWDDIERRRPVGHLAGRRRLSARAVRAARLDRAARTGVSTTPVGAVRQAARHPDGR